LVENLLLQRLVTDQLQWNQHDFAFQLRQTQPRTPTDGPPIDGRRRGSMKFRYATSVAVPWRLGCRSHVSMRAADALIHVNEIPIGFGKVLRRHIIDRLRGAATADPGTPQYAKVQHA
jgi:hypothetical protein